MVVMMQTQSLQSNGKTGAPPCLSAVCMWALTLCCLLAPRQSALGRHTWSQTQIQR